MTASVSSEIVLKTFSSAGTVGGLPSTDLLTLLLVSREKNLAAAFFVFLLGQQREKRLERGCRQQQQQHNGNNNNERNNRELQPIPKKRFGDIIDVPGSKLATTIQLTGSCSHAVSSVVASRMLQTLYFISALASFFFTFYLSFTK